MNICLFSSDEIKKPLPWDDERSQHLIKVLHKKEGDSFTAGIIEGQAGTATITHIEQKKCIEFDFKAEKDGKRLYPMCLIIGFPRPIQLKRLLRDVAGLGACEVHLTGTELTEKSYLNSTLVERGAAYQMLLDGTVQAGGTYVPKLFIHSSLKNCIESFNAVFEQNVANTQDVQNKSLTQSKTNVFDTSLKIALDNVRANCSLKSFLAKNENIEKKQALVAIGSERGWTDSERLLLEKNGFVRCRMGERILRTETAATVASSIVLNFMDVLN